MDVSKVSGEATEVDESSTSEIFHRDAENPAVCVVDGYGIQVATRSGRLIVSDGIGRQRRERVIGTVPSAALGSYASTVSVGMVLCSVPVHGQVTLSS